MTERSPGASPILCGRRAFGATFVVLLGFSILWSIAMPPRAGSDESSHIVRAAAVVRGQLTGTSTTTRDPLYLNVTVPRTYASLMRAPLCYAFRPDVAAGCDPAFPTSTKATTTAIYVARDQPTYYFLVGLPTLVFASPFGTYAMRFLNAVGCDVFLAMALALGLTALRRMQGVGVVVAITPMGLYLTGVVSPSSLEVSSAVCFWTVLVTLGRQRPNPPPRFLIAWLGVAGVALVATRPLTPLWAAAAVVSVAPLFGRDGYWRRVLGGWEGRLALGSIAAAGTASVAWTVVEHATRTFQQGPVAHGLGHVLRGALADSTHYVHEAVGAFGVDAPVPELVVLIWVALLGAIVIGAVARTRSEGKVTLGLVTLAVLVVPSATVAAAAPSHGFIGYGRYFLPLYVGLPIVAGGLLERSADAAERSVVRMTVVAAGLGQLVAFFWCLHRYAVGDSGPVSPLATSRGAWHPPIAVVVLDAAYLVLVAAAGYLILRALAASPRDPLLPRAPHAPVRARVG